MKWLSGCCVMIDTGSAVKLVKKRKSGMRGATDSPETFCCEDRKNKRQRLLNGTGLYREQNTDNIHIDNVTSTSSMNSNVQILEVKIENILIDFALRTRLLAIIDSILVCEQLSQKFRNPCLSFFQCLFRKIHVANFGLSTLLT